MSFLKKLFRGNPWEIRKCCWPYPEGYAAFNKKTRTILDTGLTKGEAEQICKELNNK